VIIIVNRIAGYRQVQVGPRGEYMLRHRLRARESGIDVSGPDRLPGHFIQGDDREAVAEAMRGVVAFAEVLVENVLKRVVGAMIHDASNVGRVDGDLSSYERPFIKFTTTVPQQLAKHWVCIERDGVGNI
jgi:hypothetical protein